MDLILACTSFLPFPGVCAWGSAGGEAAHATLGLAKALRGLGHRATLVAPLDPAIGNAGLGLARRLSPLSLALPGGVARIERTVHDARLPSGVEIVLLGGDPPSEGTSPEDVALRSALFGHAVAAIARQRLGAVAPRSGAEGELEAVISVGEGAALTSLAIREDAKLPALDGGPSHRLLAGLARVAIPLDPSADLRLPASALASIGVESSLFSTEGVEFYGQISFEKAAAVAADRVVSLGEATRLGLVREGASHRFDGVFRARGGELVSIGSGVDQAQYNPATDPHLTMRFDPEDLSGKGRGRASLLAELEVDTGPEVPLLAILGGTELSAARASEAKWQLETAIPSIGRALRGELAVVVAFARPRGEGEIDQALDRLQKTHVGRIAVRYGAQEPLLHRVLAAADLALVVDPTSATGIPARAAMRYGAVPIAARTPSMEEAIVDVEASLATGNGFLFEPGDDVFGALERAVSAFAHPAWPRLQRRVMRVEGGWERAARRLERLIQQIEG